MHESTFEYLKPTNDQIETMPRYGKCAECGMDVIERVRTAREPYRTSKVFEEARAHNALLDAEAEIARLRATLEQIAIVCTDNMDANCNHRMALDFVRQSANDANQ